MSSSGGQVSGFPYLSIIVPVPARLRKLRTAQGIGILAPTCTERNSSDKRFVNIILIDKGQEVLRQTMPVAREIVNQVMASITERDAILLEKLLRVLRENALDGFEDFAKLSQP